MALTFVFSLAMNACQRFPDASRGSRFVRHMVIPITMLMILTFGDKALRGVGLPLIDRLGIAQYLWAYSASLIGVGLWLTLTWIRHFESFCEVFTPRVPAQRTGIASAMESDGQPEETTGMPSVSSSNSGLAINGSAPAMLGRYKVLKELGRGAMGIVYLGKDPTIQRFVAIKTMRLDQIDDSEKLQEVKARFFREAESAGKLSHPNIVTIYDAGEQDDLGYIAMELLDGQALRQWSRPPHLLPPMETIQVLATVADALDHAHQEGVVHRDIKPANIMLTKDRTVKVMDFGIAKMASSSRTQTDMVLGTPTYMSPEQIGGKKVDGRSDIFSLGIVFFELLTGRPPFMADNLPALLFAIAHHHPPALQSIRKDLPPMCQEIVTRALQKDLPQRYRRAAELSQDLQACLHSLAA
ncbi:putative serine/threonine protein kinase [Nitrospira sp. KM1]|uniref:serine/threonine-protein kinase n=1 Tax=Nitrospira sp. KM1 TaxID=1936990 RepID=UPI0013A7AA8A|nr:serine/threonine-protein kinase [Nitrospira sp. KM1]BCA57015.1 putative serine/threonine protein kinase [Nitrospira sp. KM1]